MQESMLLTLCCVLRCQLRNEVQQLVDQHVRRCQTTLTVYFSLATLRKGHLAINVSSSRANQYNLPIFLIVALPATIPRTATQHFATNQS